MFVRVATATIVLGFALLYAILGVLGLGLVRFGAWGVLGGGCVLLITIVSFAMIVQRGGHFARVLLGGIFAQTIAGSFIAILFPTLWIMSVLSPERDPSAYEAYPTSLALFALLMAIFALFRKKKYLLVPA